MSNTINHDRRRFLGIAAMTLAVTELGRFGSAKAQSTKVNPKETTMTGAMVEGQVRGSEPILIWAA